MEVPVQMPSRYALALLIAITAAGAFPQDRFEVASVKLVEGGAPPHAVNLNLDHDKVSLDAATLRQMVGFAYNIQRIRVLLGPSCPEWADGEQFDVVAKAGNPNLTRDQARVLLQKLLADRFQLKVERSTKELDQYSLTLGKNGSKLKEAGAEGPRGLTPSSRPDGGWTLTIRRSNLVGLVNTIANFTGLPVKDETGLKGEYDFEVSFQHVYEDPSQDAAAGPSLFEAVEKLGLKLVKTKGPQEVLTILHAAQLTAN
jgi:uncharacterized protein (TIGR03435 family)